MAEEGNSLVKYLFKVFRRRSPRRQTPDPDDDECSICFENVDTFRLKTIRENDTREFGIVAPCCGKFFGTKCLFKWVWPLSFNVEKCPNCRAVNTGVVQMFFPKNYPKSVNVSVPIEEISLDTSRAPTPAPSDGHLITSHYILTLPGAMGRFWFRKSLHQLDEKRTVQWAKLYTTNGFLEPHVWSRYNQYYENPHNGISLTYWQQGAKRRVLTILEDDSQMWQINEEAQEKGIITVKEPIFGMRINRKRKVPAGTTHVMLSTDGKFLRWADPEQDWRRWVRWRALDPRDGSEIDPPLRQELNE